MKIKVIKNGKLIDGTGNPPLENSVVVVDGSKIISVGKEGETEIPKSDDVQVIEAKGNTVMPGLIDSHAHMGLSAESKAFYSIPIHNNSLDLALKAAAYLKKTLEMGITTLRDGGSGYSWMEVALRNAIDRGDIIGPRYIATGYHLTVTGGHGYFLPPWFAGFAPPEQCGMHCDGPEEWRKAARLNIYNGTDNVKLVASRGFLSAGLRGDAPPTAAQASVEELKAAVDEAHKMGKKVFAHANGPEAIKNSIEAGVDSVVHGWYINEECADLMVKRKIVLEPTTLCIRLIPEFGRGDMLDEMVDKAAAYCEVKVREFKMVLDKGVTVSFASDTGVPYMLHGNNARELASLVELGMSPMDAIVAGTKTAAHAIGIGDQIGTIEEGKMADIILVDGDPTKNIEVLHTEDKIKLVMKGGETIITR